MMSATPAASETLQSCLYRGTVHHARYQPLEHQFHYSLFMVYLDLAELDRVFQGRWLWSATNRPALAWFRRRDHLGDPRRPLDYCIRDLVQQKTGLRPRGAIRLLTQLRYFGYVMNPVSYYYCFDEQEHLEAVVAEINNTPWGERHCYVIPNDRKSTSGIEAGHEKTFHVSPFMPMEMQYHWKFAVPGKDLTVTVGLEREGARVFDAGLEMERQPINVANLRRSLARFPCMTATIISAIYWQALKLWWKKIPYFPHPNSLPATNTHVPKVG